MREQLSFKKKQMVDELRVLRKEYALNEKSGEVDMSKLDAKFKQTNNVSNLSEQQRNVSTHASVHMRSAKKRSPPAF